MAGIVALCMGYVLSQFYRAFLAVLTPVLKTDIGMDETQLAYASGAWFLAFALFQFPIGMLLDTVGPKRTAGFIFTVFSGVGIFLFAFATSAYAIIIAMALIGIGCSPALMAPFYIFAREYSPAKLSTLVSVFIAVGTLGNIAGSEPLAAAVEIFGWRVTAQGLGIITLIVGVAILVFARDPAKLQRTGEEGGYGELFRIKELWPIFAICLVGYVAAAGLRGLWIGPFHADVYGYSTLQIGRATLYMSIALALGTLCYGPVDRILDSRKITVLIGNGITLALCIYMATGPQISPQLGTAIFVAIGFFGASYAVQMAHGRSFLPPHLTGRGVTLLNFCSIGGAGFFQWISGPVVEAGKVAGNPQAQYDGLFLFYACIMGVAVLIYSFSKDAKPSSL